MRRRIRILQVLAKGDVCSAGLVEMLRREVLDLLASDDCQLQNRPTMVQGKVDAKDETDRDR